MSLLRTFDTGMRGLLGHRLRSILTTLGILFGVAAGALVLGEPLTPPFALAVALVAGGLVLVNRPR